MAPPDMKTIINTLKETRQLLISNFLNYTAVNFMKHHADVLDEYFCAGFHLNQSRCKTLSAFPYAIVALGGYGRKEQCIHSDVDLLFLFKRSIPDKAVQLIRDMLYPLWDMGLDVGHATRTLNECLSLAGQDIEVLTSLLDARLVCGSRQWYDQLMMQLRKKVITPGSDRIIQSLVQRNEDRHQHFGDSSYLLEPNLKDGQGGLRDYHTILWIAKIKSGLKQPEDLETMGFMSHDEYHCLTEALSFIWHVRNILHALSGRVCNQLYFEFQIKISQALDIKEKDGHMPVEIFLGTLHEKMDWLKHEFLLFLNEQGYRPIGRLPMDSIGRTADSDLRLIKNTLHFASPLKILHRPDLLLKIFEESARLNIPLSAEAIRMVREFSHLADDTIVNCPSAVESFNHILLSPVRHFNVLSEMMTTGLLVQIIPEMGAIVNRIQYDEYHLYPVDKHTLRTVKAVKQFTLAPEKPENEFQEQVYKELSKPLLLLWAALLHDIGKGVAGEDHSDAGAKLVRTILAKKKFSPSDIDTVAFLVREHLTLITTATRRDINDEETAINCASKIRDIERLKMLYLLTVADSMSTGPKAWNDWTGSLLRNFSLKVLNVLEKGELASSEAVEIVREKKGRVLNSITEPEDRKKAESLLNFMAPRYLLYANANDIVTHIQLYSRLEHADFVWDISRSEETNTRTVTICARDFPGLFSKIAGVFTLNQLDILDVQVYTWRNNIALDIFKVKPPPDLIFENERWERAEEHLQSVLSGKLNLSTALQEKLADYGRYIPYTSKRKHKIVVDNEGSSFFTIIEVFTYDFPGLLYRITDALFRCGLDVWVAKIATKVDQVVDVFYVRDFDGQKIDAPDQVEVIKIEIAKVLPETGSL
ncbi:MAG: [protein-PII] uridylyltransferase [Desulfobacterales bacterium]|nr:[protein-PII] uridylyltransferase [Desulfobacterales bacterium]MDD4071020.1 [protein-PII] uridylyltransferase [Desulfobacterales bacterium]MDD4391933.1 [protein-PII] uridylyltransferase [Desulfobacterales bacterium]